MIEGSQEYIADLATLRGHTGLKTQSEHLPTLRDRVTDEQAQLNHGLQLFRISCVATSYPNIYTVDCLDMRDLFVPEGFFAYEDDGTPCWFEHGNEKLVRSGPFEF